MREAQIKRALAHHLTQAGAFGNITHYLEEVALSNGQVRADFVDVAEMHCYEIKSDGDTLNRLLGQGSRYARVFDRVTLVTTERQLKKALPMLPLWWGVMLVPDVEGGVMTPFRPALTNTKQEPEVLATLLKRDEALDLLAARGLIRGWKSKSLYQIQSHIAKTLSLSDLKEVVQSYLLKRPLSELF